VFVLASCEIGTKIQVVSLTQHETDPPTTSRQESPVSKELITPRCHTADSAEAHNPEPFGEYEAIFQLRCNHVAVQVSAGNITAEFITRTIYAIAIKWGLAADRTEKRVIGKNLVLAQASILVENTTVALKRVLAAQRICEEVGFEFKKASGGWVKTVRAGISQNDETERSQRRAQA
jgi:hypothetical protein